MSLCNVHYQLADVAARADWQANIACCSELDPVAISVARGRQSAAVRLGISFGPLLHGETLRGHDRNPVNPGFGTPQPAAARGVGGSLKRTT
jgi:hypothetical protein